CRHRIFLEFVTSGDADAILLNQADQLAVLSIERNSYHPAAFFGNHSVQNRIFDKWLDQERRKSDVKLNRISLDDFKVKFVLEPELFKLKIILQTFNFFVNRDQRSFRVFERESHQF